MNSKKIQIDSPIQGVNTLLKRIEDYVLGTIIFLVMSPVMLVIAVGIKLTSAGPDIFWVGLSTPKQEKFMAEYLGKLNTTVMLGIGAAFDIITGRVKDASDWMKKCGLQWLFRLKQ